MQARTAAAAGEVHALLGWQDGQMLHLPRALVLDRHLQVLAGDAADRIKAPPADQLVSVALSTTTEITEFVNAAASVGGHRTTDAYRR